MADFEDYTAELCDNYFFLTRATYPAHHSLPVYTFLRMPIGVYIVRISSLCNKPFPVFLRLPSYNFLSTLLIVLILLSMQGHCFRTVNCVLHSTGTDGNSVSSTFPCCGNGSSSFVITDSFWFIFGLFIGAVSTADFVGKISQFL
jgi:hypothetical protein